MCGLETEVFGQSGSHVRAQLLAGFQMRWKPKADEVGEKLLI